MKLSSEQKGFLAGGAVGMLAGLAAAVAIWGFRSPGGILVIAGFGLGGSIGVMMAGSR